MPDTPQVPAVAQATPATRSTQRGRVRRVRLRLPATLATAIKAFGGGGEFGSTLSQLVGGSLSSITPGAAGDTEELTNPYKQECWIAASVDLRAIAVALARPVIWDRDPNDPKAEEVTSGPAYDLLQCTNPMMGALGLRVQDALNIDLGNESVHLLLDAEGKPVNRLGDGPDAMIDWPSAIVPVRGDRVKLKLHDETGLPEKWEYRVRGGGNHAWPAAAAVQYGVLPDPDRSHRFIGPMAKVMGPASMRYLASRFQSNLMRNSGSSGGWIEMEGGMPGPDEADRAREEIDGQWNDPDNAGATQALWGGKFHESGASPKSLAWPELHTLSKKDIGAVFGTGLALLGEGDSNWATYQGEWKRFTKLAMLPWFILYAEKWNRGLFARQRDPVLRNYRLRFDTETLDTLFANPSDQVSIVKGLTDSGLPLDHALRQAGIKSDPIDGADVPMVQAGRVTLRASQLTGQARAAKAAIDARMDPKQAWALAGVDSVQLVEPPPEPEPLPPAPKADPKDDDAKALPAPRARALPAPVIRKLSDAVRESTRKRVKKATAGPRKKMAAGVRKIFREMGVAQKKALEQFAEEGKVDRAGGALALYRGEPPAFTRAVSESFLAAYETDREAGPLTVREVTCDGRLLREVDGEVWDMRRTWQRVHGPAGVSLARCQDLILMQRATLTEAELDNLIILSNEAWAEALADKVSPLTVSAYETAAQDIASELGIAIQVDVTDPDWLAVVRARAVNVVEGTQSVVAARMRSDIISVLADKPTLPTLQETIRASLGELKATTTEAFKDHHARALAIARTETGIAAGVARADELRLAYEDGVITAKEWITSGQPKEPKGTVRSAHFAMDGVQTTPGTPYVVDGVNMAHPSDPTAPARLIVNCECSEAGVVDDDE